MTIPKRIIDKVINYFDGNVIRARIWFDISNPILNGLSPKEYRINGSYDRLEKLIDDALMETENAAQCT